jgi:hypothetical protein
MMKANNKILKIFASVAFLVGASLASALTFSLTKTSKKDEVVPSISLSYSQTSFTFSQGSAASIAAPTVVDNNGVSVTATFSSSPTLPIGLTLNTDGSITGTPSNFQDFVNYTIAATGTGAWNGLGNTEEISIQITRAYTGLSLTYSASSFTFTQGAAVSVASPTVTDNSGYSATATFSSSPTLPIGLTLNTDGSITGTPSGSQGSIDYTITAQGTGA